jgi:hypothetical protein
LVAVAVAGCRGAVPGLREPLPDFPSWKIRRYAAFLRKQSFVADILSGAKMSEFPGVPERRRGNLSAEASAFHRRFLREIRMEQKLKRRGAA